MRDFNPFAAVSDSDFVPAIDKAASARWR